MKSNTLRTADVEAPEPALVIFGLDDNKTTPRLGF